MLLCFNKRIIFGLICTIGCAYQLFTVTYNFLQFKVRTEITNEYPTMIEIPEIDFVIPIPNLINMSGLYLKHPKEMVSICSQILEETDLKINSIGEYNLHCSKIHEMMTTTTYALSGILTIGDIENLTPDPVSIIHAIYIDDARNDLLANNFCTSQKYFSGFHVFIRVSCRNNSKPIVKEIIQTRSANAYLICLSIQTKYNFGFNLSPSGSLLATRFRQYIIIDYKEVAFRTIYAKFRRKISKYLPFPYSTNCKHYDRSKTLINCINTRLLSNKSSPSIYIDNLIKPGAYPDHLKFADDGLADFDRKSSQQIFHECSKLIVQPECNSIVYTVQAQDHSESIKKRKTAKYGNISLCLEAQLDSDTIIQALPENTLIQWLIYIGSTLGIWFGISIYVHFQQLAKFSCKFNLNQLLPLRGNKSTPALQIDQQILRNNNTIN